MTLTPTTHELARRTALEAAATDLRNAAKMIDRLAEQTWPVRPQRVEDAQNTVELVRESLAAVDELGWPDNAS